MRKTKLLIILSCLATIFACNNDTKDETNNETTDEKPVEVSLEGLSIDAKETGISALIDSTAKIELLATGFKWSEGPVWVDALNAVLFSDVPANKIYKWSEKDSLTVYLDSAGGQGDGPNGLLLDPEGDLLICQHGNRQIALMSNLENPSNDVTAYASKYFDKKFNSPNDLVLDSMGNLYFTDPPYGQPDQKTGEIGVNGVYRVNTNGNIDLLVDTLTRPNGIALSQDQKTVYINNSDDSNPVVYSYELNEEGKLVNGKVFFDLTEIVKEKPGLPDGIKLHKSGNLFVAGPGGVLVLSPEGKLLGSINTRRPTANCAFDTNQEYLYMTANESLMRVKLK